jgi:hypothetical protein
MLKPEWRGTMRALVLFVTAVGICAGQNANLSGSWQLNVEKSHWGSKPKPVSVSLVIEHKDPALKYHGTVNEGLENTRDFSFDGAIDGKSYPMTAAAGPGQAVLKRVDANTIQSEFKSADGKRIETTRTSVSRDGKVLTRTIREKTPEGTKTWSEVYDRK